MDYKVGRKTKIPASLFNFKEKIKLVCFSYFPITVGLTMVMLISTGSAFRKFCIMMLDFYYNY